jgi:phospholipase C
MRRAEKWVLLFALMLFVGCAQFAQAQISNFEHVILIIQENRTPDNLFQGLCNPSTLCSTTPASNQYDIQTSGWLDKTQTTGVTQPLTENLEGGYDPGHTHNDFTRQCDLNTKTGLCRMDGAAGIICTGKCPTQPSFRYVNNSTGVLDPYLQLVTQYGWANYMFQTNQGPSYPAHLFLFGGTSAPSAADDAAGIFAAGNVYKNKGTVGCIAVAGSLVQIVAPKGVNDDPIYPCFEHETIPDVLPEGVTWKYYTPSANNIWTAPVAIEHICQPSLPTGGECEGTDWVNNVELKPAAVLTDIKNCVLRSLNWVIPTGQNSDHNGFNQGGGPSWIASIVNAIGQSACKNADGSTYWDSTAILITWDDWGGWYDHVSPTFLPQPQGDYQYGFRVPMMFVSAYTPAGLIENNRHDFGSMLRFVEKNFGITQGVLNFADARASDDLSTFFNLQSSPRPFTVIPSAKSADFFLNDTSVAADPDDY